MEEEQKDIVGYLHNVSPIKKSEKVSYFDMSIQTNNDVIRGVCFSPVKHTQFKDISEKKSPVKVRQFKLDNKSDNNTVLMYHNVSLDSVDDINFQPKDIPTTYNIASISAFNTNQMITIKAKLLQKSGKKKVKTANGEKSIVNAYLVDPHGTIKVTLWETFCDLEEGKTYQFENILVRREYNSKDLVLTTPRSGCKAQEIEPFKDNVVQPSELPKTFTSTTAIAKVLGLQSFTVYQACCQCKKKITLDKSAIVTCSTCGLKQKVTSTIEQCYAELYINVNDSPITVTLFHDIIKEMLKSQGKQDLTINENNLTTFFLDLETLNSITYNNKTKIVEAVSI